MARVYGPGAEVVLVSGVLALWATTARAQEPAPSPSPEPTRVEVTGFVDVYYGYNSNQLDPILRSFDGQHNTFSLSLAEVAFAKGVSGDSRLGFRVDLDFGKTAELVAAYEPVEGDVDVYKYIQQAYGTLLTGKVTWDVGKYVTPIGAEVIESQDNWNYTRSTLFGYAIPFYHMGVRATLPVNDKLTLAGYMNNGWNNSTELSGDKTFAFGATLKPSSRLTWIANYMVGKEPTRNAEGAVDTRRLFDTTLSVSASSKLTLMANVDYGSEGELKWWGVAGYAKLQARDDWALVERYEYLDDDEGGFMLIGTTAQTLTVTSDHLIAGGLKARLEYRTDFADEAIFPKDDGSYKKSQTTLTVGLVYSFGGKI